MVQSTFKSSGIFSIVFSVFAGLVMLLVMYILAFLLTHDKYPHNARAMPPAMGIVFLLFFGFLFFVLINSFRRYAFLIKIDPDNKSISFRNIFTFQTKVYDFSEFDGYFDTLINSKGGTYTSIYLIKDKKAEKIITGMYYENIYELKAGLDSIKYLGFQENSSVIARKALFNKPVID